MVKSTTEREKMSTDAKEMLGLSRGFSLHSSRLHTFLTCHHFHIHFFLSGCSRSELHQPPQVPPHLLSFCFHSCLTLLRSLVHQRLHFKDVCVFFKVHVEWTQLGTSVAAETRLTHGHGCGEQCEWECVRGYRGLSRFMDPLNNSTDLEVTSTVCVCGETQVH